MRNFDAAKRNGFTMSEVLIVLAILGFVASIILGVIKINTTKQFAAGRSLFTSDISTALSTMNIEYPLASFSGTDNSAGFSKVFFSFYDIIRKGTRDELFAADEKIRDLGGDKVSLNGYDQYFVTKNGVSVALSYVKSDTPLPKFVPDQSKISVSGEDFAIATQALSFVKGVYDLNGPKGPNILGRDIGVISSAYSVNEKQGEYFAQNSDGTFFINSKTNKIPPVTHPIVGNTGGAGGGAGACSEGWSWGGSVCCPAGQSESTSGVCAKDKEERDDKKCTLTEHYCQSIGSGWHLSEGENSFSDGHKDSSNCGCVCNLSCPSGQHLNTATCTCEAEPPVCEYPAIISVEGVEGWNNRDCKPIKGNKTEWGYKCDLGAAYTCTESGGTWHQECCRCLCNGLDQKIQNEDKITGCGLRGAACSPDGGSCSASIKEACHYDKYDTLHNNSTYSSIAGNGTALPKDDCFSCVSKDDKTTLAGLDPSKDKLFHKFGIHIDEVKSNNKSNYNNKCGCYASCDSNFSGAYAERENATSLQGKIWKKGVQESDYKESCKWICEKPSNPNSNAKYDWEGLGKCSWDCQVANNSTCSQNINYVGNNSDCKYHCNAPSNTTKVTNNDVALDTNHDIRGEWVWTSGSDVYECGTTLSSSCKWECKFDSTIENNKTDYYITRESITGNTRPVGKKCSAKKKCKLSQTICNNFVNNCVATSHDTNFKTSCPRTEDAKSAFYDRYNSTYTNVYYRCQKYWNKQARHYNYFRPHGQGFSPYNYADTSDLSGSGSNSDGDSNNFHWSAANNKCTLRHGKSTEYITCNTADYGITKSATFDSNSCSCVVNISGGNNHKPTGTKQFDYEGWRFLNRNGNLAKATYSGQTYIENGGGDSWISYTCTYNHTTSNSYSIVNSGTNIGGGFTCGTLPSNSGVSGNYKTGNVSYVSKTTEECNSDSDPIMLSIVDDENVAGMAQNFTIQKTIDISGGNGDTIIYWLKDEAAENNHPFLVKTKYIDENGTYVANPAYINGSTLVGITDLMFTDIGYSSGIHELIEYADVDKTTTSYLNDTNAHWNDLGLAIIKRQNDGTAKVYVHSLSEYLITEIWLDTVSVNRSSGVSAGAIGNIVGCYRKGIANSGISALPNDGNSYVRVTRNGVTKYCPSLNEDFNNCIFESGTNYYRIDKTMDSSGNVNGYRCNIASNMQGKNIYVYYNGLYYKEKAYPFVDAMFVLKPESNGQ